MRRLAGFRLAFGTASKLRGTSESKLRGTSERNDMSGRSYSRRHGAPHVPRTLHPMHVPTGLDRSLIVDPSFALGIGHLTAGSGMRRYQRSRPLWTGERSCSPRSSRPFRNRDGPPAISVNEVPINLGDVQIWCMSSPRALVSLTGLYIGCDARLASQRLNDLFTPSGGVHSIPLIASPLPATSTGRRFPHPLASASTHTNAIRPTAYPRRHLCILRRLACV